ncbi:MAG: FeoA family protein [Clostridiales bacterium]
MEKEVVRDIEKYNKTLNDANTGDVIKVYKIDTKEKSKLRKLMVFGIFEGVEIKLTQKFPVNIIQVGFTQVALDKEVSSIIKIEKQK